MHDRAQPGKVLEEALGTIDCAIVVTTIDAIAAICTILYSIVPSVVLSTVSVETHYSWIKSVDSAIELK